MKKYQLFSRTSIHNTRNLRLPWPVKCYLNSIISVNQTNLSFSQMKIDFYKTEMKEIFGYLLGKIYLLIILTFSALSGNI